MNIKWLPFFDTLNNESSNEFSLDIHVQILQALQFSRTKSHWYKTYQISHEYLLSFTEEKTIGGLWPLGFENNCHRILSAQLS